MAPDWSNLPPDHTLSKFAAELEAVIKDAGHNEMYGVQLESPSEGCVG
jgi:phosphatidylinositol transfer protein SFH5